MSHSANTHVNSLPINASLQVSGISSVGSCSTINQPPQNAYTRGVDRVPHEGNNSLPCAIQTFSSQGVNGSMGVVDGSVLQAINKYEGKQGKIFFASERLTFGVMVLYNLGS